MEFNTESKPRVLALLKYTKSLLDLDDRMYKELKLHERYDREFNYVNWEHTLNAVYLEMVGESKNTVYSMFECAAQSGKPIAWYAEQLTGRRASDGSIMPPAPHLSAFIPDCINNLIWNSGEGSENASQKYYLLELMFKDLLRLNEEYLQRTENNEVPVNTIANTTDTTFSYTWSSLDNVSTTTEVQDTSDILQNTRE